MHLIPAAQAQAKFLSKNRVMPIYMQLFKFHADLILPTRQQDWSGSSVRHSDTYPKISPDLAKIFVLKLEV